MRFAVLMGRYRLPMLVDWEWVLMAVPEPLLPCFLRDRVPSTFQSLIIFSLNFYGLLAFFLAQTGFGLSQKIDGPEAANIRTETGIPVLPASAVRVPES